MARKIKNVGFLIGMIVGCAVLGLHAAPSLHGEELTPSQLIPSSDIWDEKKKHPFKKLHVREIEPLAFGLFVKEAHGIGMVVIDPIRKQQMAYHGNSVAGPAGPAKFGITGEPNSPFSISLPREVTLHLNGGQRLRLVKLRSYPSESGTLGPDGRATLFVGGTLLIESSQVFGKASGAFDVFVDYVYP